MNNKMLPYFTEYRGATGPYRVPLKEAVWSVLLSLRGTEQFNTSIYGAILAQEAQLSGETIEVLSKYVERAVEDLCRASRSRTLALCQNRAKYEDRAILGEELALMHRQERRLRDQYLRRLSTILTRSELRRLVAWISSDARANMAMHAIDHRQYVQSVDTVDEILDRACKGVDP